MLILPPVAVMSAPVMFLPAISRSFKAPVPSIGQFALATPIVEGA